MLELRPSFYGGGGGGLQPAAPGDMIQDLRSGVESDGLTLKDARAGVNTDEPLLRNINTPSMAGADYFNVSSGDVGDLGFYVSGWLNTVATTRVAIVANDDNTSSRSYRVDVEANGKLRLALSPDGSSSVSYDSTSAVNDGNTHSFICYYTDSKVFIYIDGVIEKAYNGLSSVNKTTDDTYVCAWKGSTLSFLWEGSLSDVKHAKENTEIPIYFIWGQSNAVGSPGGFGSLRTDLQTTKQPWRYSTYNNGTPVEEFVLPVTSTKWGIEINTCDTLFQETGQRAAFVKMGVSGAVIDDFLKSDPNTTGYYQDMLDLYNDLITELTTQGYTPSFKKFITLHGESDAVTQVLADAYLDKYDSFISDLETDLGLTIEGNTIVCNIPAENNPGSSTMTATQRAIGSRAGNNYIYTIGLDLVDAIHYSPDGLLALSNLIVPLIRSSLLDAPSTVVYNYPMQEGSAGVYDVSGNGLHSSGFAPTWTTTDDVPSYNHANGYYTAVAGTAPFIPALLDGSAAANGESLDNRGGFVHNESECDIEQVDFSILDSVMSTVTTTDTLLEKDSDTNYNGIPQPTFSFGETAYLNAVSDNTWEYGTTAPTRWTNPSTNVFPPKTGWVPDGGEPPLTIAYNSFWVDYAGDAFEVRTKAELDTHYNNTNGSLNLWLKNAGDNTYRASQYPLARGFTPAEVLRNEKYFGGTSGALRDVGGELITDVNGYVIFTA